MGSRIIVSCLFAFSYAQFCERNHVQLQDVDSWATAQTDAEVNVSDTSDS